MIYALALWAAVTTYYLFMMHGVHTRNADYIRRSFRALARPEETL